MAATLSSNFEFTATGVLGDKRETMLQNQLLLRNQLGKPITRGYSSYYPGDGVRFGRQNLSNDGGAPAALGSWRGGGGGLPFPKKGSQSAGGGGQDRDFMALNIKAVQNGLTTAPEQYQFRATHDVRQSVRTDEEKTSNKTRRLPPNMVYGIATRPSTPIHDLLEHKYQDKWLRETKDRHATLSCSQNGVSQSQGKGKVNETRASLLRIHQVPVEAAPLWQMPKFSRSALPHLETFRGGKARDGAFRHHQSDCISRKGVFGHGVYEAAKN